MSAVMVSPVKLQRILLPISEAKTTVAHMARVRGLIMDANKNGEAVLHYAHEICSFLMTRS